MSQANRWLQSGTITSWLREEKSNGSNENNGRMKIITVHRRGRGRATSTQNVGRQKSETRGGGVFVSLLVVFF